MKKLLFSAALISLTAFGASAQDHAGHNHGTVEASTTATTATTAATATPAATSLTEANLAFKEERHAFGNVREGEPAQYVFTFKNTGKEPILINDVKVSCGCTTPDWTRTPVPPGKTGTVTASYGTAGRVGAFDKNLTVMSNAGNKMLYISGNVEKAPETSAPTNNSMIRTN